jgi:hypothetical protein
MKRSLIIIVAIVFMFVGIRQGLADELTAEKKADIGRLLKLINALQVGTIMANQMSQQLVSSIQSKNPSLPAKAVDIIRDETQKVVGETISEKGGLTDLMTGIYHHHLTHEEVRGLISFYQSPLGKKLLEVNPLIGQETFAVAMTLGQRISPVLDRRIKDRLSQEGIKIQN